MQIFSEIQEQGAKKQKDLGILDELFVNNDVNRFDISS